jgi:hypothetical protein
MRVRATLRDTIVATLVTIAAAAAAYGDTTVAPATVLRIRSHLDGSIEARIVGAPLPQVLEALATETGAIVSGIDASDQTRLTFEFGPLALRQALDRILGSRSFMATTSRTGDCERLTRIILLGGGDQTQIAVSPTESERPGPAVAEDTVDLPEESLVAEMASNPDPGARLEAMHVFAASGRTTERDRLLVRTALDDEDGGVRREAFDLLAAGDGVPADVALALVRRELEPELRRHALPALAGYVEQDGDARATVAWLADNDPDSDVRAMAWDMLAGAIRE